MRQDKAIKYLRHAASFAREFSKDRSTQVGALFLHPADFTILTAGYNGQPRGADDSAPERHERPLKYEYFEHGERNGIFNAVRHLLRGSICLTTEVPSMSTARAVISVGVRELWFPHSVLPTDGLARALALLAETGVQARSYRGQTVTAEPLRHAQKLTGYLAHARSLASNLAKDPRAGATLFLEPGTYTQLAEGYSGMPRGSDDAASHRYEGEERQFWVEDSVRNAIYNKARPLLAGSVAVVTEMPCSECLRAIAAVGASAVVTTPPEAGFQARWAAQIERTRAMAAELGIPMTFVPREALAPAELEPAL
jgi:deoxycytidylate deaminase